MEQIIKLKSPDGITAFAESRIGGRRENQDSFGSATTPLGYVVTVCDGMGGGPGGKTASTIAVQEIITSLLEVTPDETEQNALAKAIRRANLAIIARGQEEPSLKGMGSTCTVLLINKDCATVAHVGDSRVYQFSGHTKAFRTFDHSMVFEMVKNKVISEEQARLSDQSNVITRALGIRPDVEVDIATLPYCPGDRFMLTTDGIHGAMPEKKLIAMATDRKHTLGAVTDAVCTEVDSLGRTAGGGHDNLTIALIETSSHSKLTKKMSLKHKATFAAICLVCAISFCFNIKQCSKISSMQKEIEQAGVKTDSLQQQTIEATNLVNQINNSPSTKK